MRSGKQWVSEATSSELWIDLGKTPEDGGAERETMRFLSFAFVLTLLFLMLYILNMVLLLLCLFIV